MTLAAPAPDQGSGNGKTHSQSFTSGTHGFKVPIPAGPKGYKPTGAASGSPESIANMKDKIKNVVHILMENRSFDNIVGGQTSIPVDGPARNGPFCNAVNITDPNSAVICSQAKDFDSITNDPDHSIAGNNFQNYGTFMPDNAAVENGTFVAGQQGFLQDHLRKYPKLNATYAAAQVMNYYTPDQVPVITSFCENFVTFDKWHSCVPGVSAIAIYASFRPNADEYFSQPTQTECAPSVAPLLDMAATTTTSMTILSPVSQFSSS